jgi:hypothetical protein
MSGISPRASPFAKKSVLSESLAPESLMAMKALNVTVDGDKELPDTLRRSDVGLKVLVSLEKSSNADSTKRAKEIQTIVNDQLSQVYTAKVEDCAYLLKIYVVLACDRSILNKLTLGVIGEPKTECLEWFLEKNEIGESQTCKAGRVGIQKKFVGQISAMTKELCDTLVEKIGIP